MPGPDGAVRDLTIEDGGRSWPALAWSAPAEWWGVSTAVVGGGLGPVDGWVNVMVHRDYDEPDPPAHVRRLADGLGAGPHVVGMITAADVGRRLHTEDGGVHVTATVGLGYPTLAAAERDPWDGDQDGAATPVGTINLLVRVPVPLTDGALVNLVVTATEAKTQALVEAGLHATGTASDAVCVVCPRRDHTPMSSTTFPTSATPDPVPRVAVEPYGGPRSPWGARAARAVHRAVLDGARDWLAMNAGDPRGTASGWPRRGPSPSR